ncbi:uroporphyrinogen-III synthase [Rubellimicrobium roseum]|uniref:Uroporphyrinogen-III synthase n=1 Tax=Rubellimicrobium roseum TaxID=687525 RepID=A0A5C4NHU0_9RHOB|nr:uroporphyrinogen-III synthase [Rubellimicrobium roseum]TNC74331.1 uroporphyrinogen-III synthase [Rubellimicrobium roseum]
MTDGARLLLTRPEAASRRFLAACEAGWGRPIPALVSPVMEIVPVPVVLAGRPAALVLTSENGATRAGELDLSGLPAWCVGPRTADVARRAGLRPVAVARDAEGLLATILVARPAGPLLHLRGEHGRGDLAARLGAAGIVASEAVAYRQQERPPSPEARTALDGPDSFVAPVFSPRSALLLAGWHPRAALHVVAISPAVAAAAATLCPASLVVAPHPEGSAMVEATLGRLDRLLPRRLEANGGAD